MPIGGTAAFGINQHPRITTTYLNQLNRHGDPAPGVNVSTAQVSGSIVQPYDGFVGGKLTITGPWAKQFADPDVGPLYGGIYQYVQFSPLMTTPAARGAICFWVDEAQYIVTTDYDAALSYKIAGVIINEDLPGNWDFIQIAGIAMTMFGAAGAVGDMVSADTAASPVTAEIGAAADQTSIGLAVMLAPAAGAASPVQLNILAGWNY
jgi:hypothetical protein